MKKLFSRIEMRLSLLKNVLEHLILGTQSYQITKLFKYLGLLTICFAQGPWRPLLAQVILNWIRKYEKV